VEVPLAFEFISREVQDTSGSEYQGSWWIDPATGNWVYKTAEQERTEKDANGKQINDPNGSYVNTMQGPWDNPNTLSGNGKPGGGPP
jgi:hypothetical protein